MANIGDVAGLEMDKRVTIEVSNLFYSPNTPVIEEAFQFAKQVLPSSMYRSLHYYRHAEKSSPLENISFRASPTKLTAVLSDDSAARRTIVELIAGRRNYGVFDGQINVHTNQSLVNADQVMAFVPRAASKLYTPGLTYLEMITYAAKLRMHLHPSFHSIGDYKARKTDNIKRVNDRVMEVLKLMGLLWCKDRLITERPTTRGTLGGELRKLSIAVEIINLPPVIILDDITTGLDAFVSSQIMSCLTTLTEKGYTVICTLQKPPAQVFNQLDNIVLVSNGRSIYASSKDNIIPYFTSDPINYHVHSDTEVIDFLFHIADGTERPVASRQPLDSLTLQHFFLESNYCPKESAVELTSLRNKYLVLPEGKVLNYGYFSSSTSTDGSMSFADIFSGSLTVIERAIFVKLKEFEVLKKSLKSSIVIGLFLGLFMYGQGSYGDYSMQLLGIPYPETSNLTGTLFIMLSVIYVQQILNVHIICQKIQVFRYERNAKCTPTVGFFIASFVSEVPFTVLFALINANIIYFLADLNSGADKYFFYMGIQTLVGIVGLTTTIMLASVFRREIVVRDLYLFFLFMMMMTAGFVFQQPAMNDFIVDISCINCLRWAYEAIMVWKFDDYLDGPQFLENYKFSAFDKSKAFGILINFIIFDLVIFFIALIPIPNTLQRKSKTMKIHEEKDRNSRIESVDDIPRGSNANGKDSSNSKGKAKAKAELAKPNLFARESSITGVTRLSSRNSAHGLETEDDNHGPKVTFRNISYRVADAKSPIGYKNVIQPMTGRFEWGKLGAIIGADGSGKSSLLSVLGGQYVGTTCMISGQVYYNNNLLSENQLLPWQRCAYVESLDEHFRDLTVKEILDYAMQLRCLEVGELKSVDINVSRTLDLLQLTECANIKSKHLDPGSLRRLTIAEELVHGPSLILADEPITGLSAKDSSIIMTGAFRELVNQDRTVICTLHQPSSAVFQLIDTLCVLSRGRLIYMGPANKAVNFFVDSATINFDFKEYSNPADFFFDVSACQMQNKNGEYIDAPVLENHYRQSEFAGHYMVSIMEMFRDKNSTDGGDYSSANPLQSQERGAKSMEVSKLDDSPNLQPNQSRTQSRYYTAVSVWADGVQNVVCLSLSDIEKINISMQFVKLKILLVRSFYRLGYRAKLTVGGSCVVLYLSLLFSLILGKSTDESTTVTGLFAIGTLCIFLSNMQYVFWLFTNNQVFLKEHSRGLYSSVLQWMVDDIPLLILRTFQCAVYAIPVHEIVRLRSGQAGGFYFLAQWVSFLAGTILVESIVLTLPDVRSAYTAIPALGFMLFFFSGIVIKPSTLPDWLASWLPSVSLVRWMTQALVINEYEVNRDAFPEVGPNKYSTYAAYLNLFGWGGKTKSYCLQILVLNMFLYKIFNLFMTVYTATSQRGKRNLRKVEKEDRMY